MTVFSQWLVSWQSDSITAQQNLIGQVLTHHSQKSGLTSVKLKRLASKLNLFASLKCHALSHNEFRPSSALADTGLELSN